jgi:hypothetical protein
MEQMMKDARNINKNKSTAPNSKT